jgi:hypothetical protein
VRGRIPNPGAVREMRDGVPATELQQIRNRLEIAMSVPDIKGAALKDQGADVDREAALALQRCVGDKLDRQSSESTASLAGWRHEEIQRTRNSRARREVALPGANVHA